MVRERFLDGVRDLTMPVVGGVPQLEAEDASSSYPTLDAPVTSTHTSPAETRSSLITPAELTEQSLPIDNLPPLFGADSQQLSSSHMGGIAPKKLLSTSPVPSALFSGQDFVQHHWEAGEPSQELPTLSAEPWLDNALEALFAETQSDDLGTTAQTEQHTSKHHGAQDDIPE